jgi:hypothetical protein
LILAIHTRPTQNRPNQFSENLVFALIASALLAASSNAFTNNANAPALTDDTRNFATAIRIAKKYSGGLERGVCLAYRLGDRGPDSSYSGLDAHRIADIAKASGMQPEQLSACVRTDSSTSQHAVFAAYHNANVTRNSASDANVLPIIVWVEQPSSPVARWHHVYLGYYGGMKWAGRWACRTVPVIPGIPPHGCIALTRS